MKNTNQENIQNISPETIDYFMKKGQQERSDSIYKMFAGMKCQICYFFKIMNICKDSNNERKHTTRHCEFKTTQSNHKV